jgi:drug/metabolite transporter (DMT)-like permease
MTRFLALSGVICISFSAIFVRLAAVSPTTAAFFRCAYAVPFLLLLWWMVRERDHRLRISRWLAFASGLILSLDLSVWHYCIMMIGAGLATVLGNTQVAFVGLAAWLLHRERPTNLALVVIPVIFLGVVLISGLGRVDAYGEDPTKGVFFGVLTGISYATFLLVFRRSNRELAPASGPLLDSTVGAAIGCLVVGALFEPGFSLTWVWPAHGWLLALALGSQVVGWLLIAIALPRLAALETSVILLLQPMLTVLWARLIFVERLSNPQWAGVALVLGGIAAVTRWGSVVRKRPQRASN